MHLYLYSLNLGVLQKLAGIDLLFDGIDRREVVRHAVDLTRAGRTGGVRDGESELLPPIDLGEALHQQIDEGSLCVVLGYMDAGKI